MLMRRHIAGRWTGQYRYGSEEFASVVGDFTWILTRSPFGAVRGAGVDLETGEHPDISGWLGWGRLRLVKTYEPDPTTRASRGADGRVTTIAESLARPEWAEYIEQLRVLRPHEDPANLTVERLARELAAGGARLQYRGRFVGRDRLEGEWWNPPLAIGWAMLNIPEWRGTWTAWR